MAQPHLLAGLEQEVDRGSGGPLARRSLGPPGFAIVPAFRMRGEAEGAIRRAQAEMAAEFTERTNALVAAEQALIERLHGTAGVLHQAVDDLRERQAAASALGDATASAAAAPRSLMSVPDLDGATDEFSHLPPPPITDVR